VPSLPGAASPLLFGFNLLKIAHHFKTIPKANKCFQGCRENETSVHCWWGWKMVQLHWLGGSYGIACLAKHKTLSSIPCIGKRKEMKTYLHTHVHSGIIQNSQSNQSVYQQINT
jgi:hypothetical protein